MNRRRAQNVSSTTATCSLTSSDRRLYSNNVTSFDEETIRRLQQNVDETRKMNIQVERAKDIEEAKQVDLENHLHKISATISELHDAITKSKRREEELSKQIESWVELIKNHKQMVEREDARFQSVSEESEQLCDDLEFNIDLLKRKRISVDALVLDLAQTREHHGVFVKQLCNDLKRQKNELETWDKRSLDNKQPLVRLGERYKIASNELELRKARFAENQAAIAVLTSRLSFAHCDDVVASVSPAPSLIVQGALTPVNPQPMKAQTMTLAPVLVQNNNKRGRHTSESLVEMPMEFESRAPAYFARMDLIENHPHKEIQQCAKKSDSFITSQIREVLRTGRSSTNLFKKSPTLEEKQNKKSMEEITPQIVKKSIEETSLTERKLRASTQENHFDSMIMSGLRADLFERLGHVNDTTLNASLRDEEAAQRSQQPQTSKENVIQADRSSPIRKDERASEHERLSVPKEEKAQTNKTPPVLKGQKDPENAEPLELEKDKAQVSEESPLAREADKAKTQADGESSTPKEDKAKADGQKLLTSEKKTYANEESSTRKEEKENVQPNGATAHAPINEKTQADGESSTPKAENVQGYQELSVSNKKKAQADHFLVLDKDQVNDLADKLLASRK